MKGVVERTPSFHTLPCVEVLEEPHLVRPHVRQENPPMLRGEERANTEGPALLPGIASFTDVHLPILRRTLHDPDSPAGDLGAVLQLEVVAGAIAVPNHVPL